MSPTSIILDHLYSHVVSWNPLSCFPARISNPSVLKLVCGKYPELQNGYFPPLTVQLLASTHRQSHAVYTLTVYILLHVTFTSVSSAFTSLARLLSHIRPAHSTHQTSYLTLILPITTLKLTSPPIIRLLATISIFP